MKYKELEKDIYRIEIHKDFDGLTKGTCVVNKQDLETVLKELKRLQEENRKLKERNKRQQEQNKIDNIKILMQRGQLKIFNEKFINKDKIREKLEEVKKYERIEMKKLNHKSMAFHYANGRETLAKEILEELLEGK